MSRGFVKEDDQEEAPFIPPRASLPPGTVNYVTPEGQRRLHKEREDLENELRNLDISNDKERRHAVAVLNGKLNLLRERIASARVLDPKDQPQEEVRFGATVRFRFLPENTAGREEELTIVGVDEADIARHKIGFLAPLARALTGKSVGDKVSVQMKGKLQELQILKISYS